jgi:methylated-DNA-[protein]-cysteine S-methyltransferase
MKYGYYKSPIGYIKIEAKDDYITALDFVVNIGEEKPNEIIVQCKSQLEEYFLGKRKEFDIEIKFLKGTEFQIKVWEALRCIPYGKTVSYKWIAEKIGNPKAVRAIGGANNKNPIAIIVPCHRVIGSNGKMVGYAGGIEKKQFLLKIENK